MKPDKLRIPFSFEKRKVLYKEGVLYIPDHLPTYDYPITIDQLLPAAHTVELGSGNGHWICEKAQQHPKSYFVAIEKRFDRVQKIWAKKQAQRISNMLIVWARAEVAIHCFYLRPTIQELYVHFPDPWPKRRHRKNRLFQLPFLVNLKKALLPTAKVFLVTDQLEYGKEAAKNLIHCQFRSTLAEPGFQELTRYANSTFELLWSRRGQKIYYFAFEVARG